MTTTTKNKNKKMLTSSSFFFSPQLLLLLLLPLVVLVVVVLPSSLVVKVVQVVDAFPFGAGGCPRGRPAVDGAHLSSSLIGGGVVGSSSSSQQPQPGLVSQDLLAAGFPVMINGIPLSSGTSSSSSSSSLSFEQQLRTDTEYILTLSTTSEDSFFRGILVRAEKLGTASTASTAAEGGGTDDDGVLEIAVALDVVDEDNGGDLLFSAAGACGCPTTTTSSGSTTTTTTTTCSSAGNDNNGNGNGNKNEIVVGITHTRRMLISRWQV